MTLPFSIQFTLKLQENCQLQLLPTLREPRQVGLFLRDVKIIRLL